MSAPRITIVDYGIGNLYSVQRALEQCGAEVTLARTAQEIADAGRLVLPGVGAFADGMHGLRERELVAPLLAHAAAGKPLLGICLGMQLLATTSKEFGSHNGLNLIPGRVVPIPADCTEGERRKVPFIGWAKLSTIAQAKTENTVLNELRRNQSVYLVHSYYFSPDHEDNLVATYDYLGAKMTAVVRSNNIYGFQFHPEKSSEVGLGLLRAFLQL